MRKKVVVKISELTKAHNISLRELSRISDVRHAALSELANGKRESISFSHIERIAEALNISDIREIIELVDDEGRYSHL
ncbi:helix-turn-helix domain-containing protein [Paenibacillus sp. Y412MC10]|uniref:helix-turn-helix domain-containing protein n=1 Tax=unclassified Paenibacillus TaxID=185978 RepID=UPI0001788BF1|nr:helix-turn-helix transcriptional regulator [Paenibacillus sp. Y412MC10]ACX62578.1 transcriptional regulator, XRE family [Paenibacillus sp. Y412MC10]